MTSISITHAQSVEGVYRLSGGHEMVAAFEFKKDSFEFYFVYGAVDRHASGRFSIRNNNIFFLAEKEPGKDFTIVHEEKRGSGTSVQVSDPNAALLSNILVVFKKGDKVDQQFSDGHGYIHSDLAECDSVFIIHTLFPDLPTMIREGNRNQNNYFELHLNASLAELSFHGFSLQIGHEGLTGHLPYLFEQDEALFVKQAE